MPIGIKLVVSMALIALISGVALANPDASLDRRNKLSRRRARDRIRSLMFRPDGAMRREAQPAGLLLLYSLLAIVWFVVPLSSR